MNGKCKEPQNPPSPQRRDPKTASACPEPAGSTWVSSPAEQVRAVADRNHLHHQLPCLGVTCEVPLTPSPHSWLPGNGQRIKQKKL